MCPRRIEEDHKDFIDVVSGKLRKALKKFIKSGQIVKSRGKRGKISITIPKIDIPQILYGDNGNGIGRGKGKDGDVIDKGRAWWEKQNLNLISSFVTRAQDKENKKLGAMYVLMALVQVSSTAARALPWVTENL